MKTLSFNFFKLFCCLLILVWLQSCSNEIGAWKNDKIKQSNHDELGGLNSKVIKCLKDNDLKSLEPYLSKELFQDNYTANHVQHASNQLRQDSFVNFDEYYTVNKYIQADTINNLSRGANSYRLVYPGMAQEMYISMLVPKNTSAPNKSMITLVYAHFDYGWKLNILTVGLYTINGKTATGLYELAKAEYKQNYLIAAANTMSLAASCNRPNDIWQYIKEDELYKFFQQTADEANKKFHYPIILDKVSTQPRIVRLYNLTSADGTYPNIIYLTKISVKNIDAIKRENDEIKKVIGAALPGIDKNKKYVTYSAYNEMPDGTRVVPHYDIKDVLQP